MDLSAFFSSYQQKQSSMLSVRSSSCQHHHSRTAGTATTRICTKQKKQEEEEDTAGQYNAGIMPDSVWYSSICTKTDPLGGNTSNVWFEKMTSPPENITVTCPKCGKVYEDWYRASVNLALDDFDDDYLEQCSSATCPACGFKVRFENLVVDRDGTFIVPGE